MVCNGRALQNVQMYKLNMVLDVHPYAITAPSKTGGRWQTYVTPVFTRIPSHFSERETGFE